MIENWISTKGENKMFSITKLENPTDENVVEIAFLTRQLSSSAVVPNKQIINEILKSPGNHWFVCWRDGKIVGMLTLILFRIPSGLRGLIEDVVVDESMRRLGYGELLVLKALEFAKQFDVKTIDLTSRPARESANKLYEKVGFTRRETNVWRFETPQK